jgi:hypothetical protein
VVVGSRERPVEGVLASVADSVRSKVGAGRYEYGCNPGDGIGSSKPKYFY